MFIMAGIANKSHRAVYEKFKDGTVKDISDELPFEIPATWRWARLGNIFEIARGGSPRPINEFLTEDENGLNWIKIADATASGKYITATRQKIKPEGLKKSRSVFPGDLLLTNSMSFGNPYILRVEGCIHDGWLVLHPLDIGIDREFFYWLLSSSFAYAQFTDTASGGVVQNLNTEKVIHSLFPLPPLAEQKRIVSKIETLMPLVEEYGKMEETRLQLDADLPTALEKSILQEAIQGKLVPQDPNDEPASELLKRIAAERKALVKAGKLKRDKTESVIFRSSDRLAYETRDGETVCIQDEIPFEIPDSWEWVRLGNITTFLHRGKSPTYVPHSDCPMFAQKCNQWDGIHLEKCKFCDEAKYKTFQDEYHLRDYDIVVNSTGTGTLGRVGIFHDCELVKLGYLSIVPDSHVTVVRTSLHDLSQYIYHYLCTKFCWEWMNNNADGSTKQKELYTSTLASLLIPIPPLAEQRRIASAIPLLLNNCNQLKQQPTM